MYCARSWTHFQPPLGAGKTRNKLLSFLRLLHPPGDKAKMAETTLLNHEKATGLLSFLSDVFKGIMIVKCIGIVITFSKAHNYVFWVQYISFLPKKWSLNVLIFYSIWQTAQYMNKCFPPTSVAVEQHPNAGWVKFSPQVCRCNPAAHRSLMCENKARFFLDANRPEWVFKFIHQMEICILDRNTFWKYLIRSNYEKSSCIKITL